MDVIVASDLTVFLQNLVLHSLAMNEGDEVICSTFTFCVSPNPIIFERARPVFMDSDRTSWTVVPNLLEKELKDCDRRQRLPRDVVAVDILGHTADMDVILEMASRYEVPAVEDAVQALGSTYKDLNAR